MDAVNKIKIVYDFQREQQLFARINNFAAYLLIFDPRKAKDP
jgi:hypothetical protein